jgi:hypothetical protein
LHLTYEDILEWDRQTRQQWVSWLKETRRQVAALQRR